MAPSARASVKTYDMRTRRQEFDKQSAFFTFSLLYYTTQPA